MKKDLKELLEELEEYSLNWILQTRDSVHCDYSCTADSKRLEFDVDKWKFTDKQIGGEADGTGDTIEEAIVNCLEKMKQYGKCFSDDEINKKMLLVK